MEICVWLNSLYRSKAIHTPKFLILLSSSNNYVHVLFPVMIIYDPDDILFLSLFSKYVYHF